MKLLEELQRLKNPQKAADLARFFKTGPGEYAEGDTFWGIVVPQIRSVVKQYKKSTSLPDIITLIEYPVHEVRLCGLLLLVEYAKTNPQKACSIYLSHTKYINNWDLVDLTAEHVVGPVESLTRLHTLTQSNLLWERRIAMLATFYHIKRGNDQPTYAVALLLLNDSHDLIHKAVGWMLREAGKRVSLESEYAFLDSHAHHMPRTMLRYAIERFEPAQKAHYLAIKKTN